MIVRWRASILSQGSDSGMPILVGQNEVRNKWRNLCSTIQCNIMAFLILIVYNLNFSIIWGWLGRAKILGYILCGASEIFGKPAIRYGFVSVSFINSLAYLLFHFSFSFFSGDDSTRLQYCWLDRFWDGRWWRMMEGWLYSYRLTNEPSVQLSFKKKLSFLLCFILCTWNLNLEFNRNFCRLPAVGWTVLFPSRYLTRLFLKI